jgi:hypothetical protein
MDKQKAYKEKVSAEISEYSAKLAALKAKLMSEAAGAKVASMEKIHEIEEKLSHVKEKLVDVGDVAEGSWGAIKDRLEVAREEVSASVKKLFADHNKDDNKK